MKKFLVIFIGLMMIVSARADDPAPAIPQSGTLTHSDAAVAGEVAPKYGFKEITADDQEHIATTAYVKGAHNTTLTAINYLGVNKQDKLGAASVSGNDAAGSVVTGISASNGVISVSRGEVTLPVGAASGNSVSSHASIWIQ